MTWAVQGLGEDNVNKPAEDGDSAVLLGFRGCFCVSSGAPSIPARFYHALFLAFRKTQRLTIMEVPLCCL